MVNKEALEVIQLAFETPSKAEFGKMECERGLGSDYCAIEVQRPA